VSKFSENSIEIKYNFVNPNKLAIDQLATYGLTVKNPSIFITKEFYLPLSESSFKNSQPMCAGPIPAQIYDENVAKSIV
jgi:hypothetical protein